MIKILLTNSFKKQYKKLDNKIQKKFLEKLEIILKNWLQHPSLRIHKLKWKLNFSFSLTINMNFRAIFYKNFSWENLIIEFYSIWTHDIYNNS